MAEDNTISDAIEVNAVGPKRASGDQGSMEQHPLPDQIAADKYKRSLTASRVGWGVRRVKFVPPGGD